jgi:hypothetical protein
MDAGHSQLHAVGDDHVYELTIGSDALPTSVEDNPRSGLGIIRSLDDAVEYILNAFARRDDGT